ncbi:MAG: helix-turn-helix domain-containing protein [Aeromonas sp.]|uniref:helix-turn-helix domain-containing protein n=1 Tax=Aeromonas sp. TaxID=647 RepID=UPI002FC6DAB9
MGKSVSNIIARSTLYLLEESGVNTDAIKTQCQLSQYELERTNGRLSQKQHLRFIKAASAYDFLWQERLSQSHSPASLIDGAYEMFPDLVGYCLNQPTAEEAVLGYIRNRIIIGNCDNFAIARADDQLVITYVEDQEQAQRNHSAIGNFMLLKELVRLYAPGVETAVSLRGAAKPGSKQLDEDFGCHCQFDQAANVIHFKSAALTSRAEHYLPLLNRNQHQQISRRVAALEYEQGFSSLVMSLLEQAIENNVLNDEASFMEYICGLFGMSRWTINARLNQENSHLSMLLKKVRIKKACAWLAETDLSIQDISERLRFSSLSVFSRFFSTHMGSSPLHYRRRLGQGG